MRAFAAFALALVVASPALAETPEVNRRKAALVEWTVANCPLDGIPAIQVAIAGAIANGSTPEQMVEARTFVRAGVASNYADAAAACREFVKLFAQRQ